MLTPIESIEVGDRRRQDYGDLDGLSESIRRYGLIHPIVIDSSRRLIAGGRRLEACRILGFSEVETRDFGELSETERREIELEENLRRKDLTPYEQARELVRKAPVVAEALAAKSAPKTPRGEPRQMAAPKADVAQALGIGETTLREAEQHVATAEAYPFMQNPNWSQSAVLQAKKALDKLGSGEKVVVAQMVADARDDVKLGIEIAEKVANSSSSERDQFLRLASSEDDRDRSAARTWAATREPMPDPRLTIYRRCIIELKDSLKRYRDEPEDVFVNRGIANLESAIDSIKSNPRGDRIGTTDH